MIKDNDQLMENNATEQTDATDSSDLNSQVQRLYHQKHLDEERFRDLQEKYNTLLMGNVKEEKGHTIVVKTEPGTTPTVNIVHLIQPQGCKNEIHDSAKAVEKTPLTEINGVINAKIFRAKFLDYLESLGLRQAVSAIQITQLDVDTGTVSEEMNQGKILQLLADDSSKDRWRQSYAKLKSSIAGELYETLVESDSTKEHFFTLWQRVCRLVGDTGTEEEAVFLMTEWENLTMPDGTRLSEQFTSIDRIANKVNTIKRTAIYGDFTKIAKLKNTLIDFPAYKTPIEHHIITGETSWRKVKANFFKFAPRGPHGEELPNTSASRATHIANSANADKSKDKCKIPGHGGHLAKDCRSVNPSKTKTYTGIAMPNNECKNWVNHGRCDWATSPHNRSKRGCKFNHGPSTRKQGNWDESKRTVNPEANAAVIPAPNESHESLANQVIALTKVVEKLYKTNTQQTSQAPKQAPDHLPQSYISIMSPDEDDLEECFGWTNVVERIEDDTAAHERQAWETSRFIFRNYYDDLHTVTEEECDDSDEMPALESSDDSDEMPALESSDDSDDDEADDEQDLDWECDLYETTDTDDNSDLPPAASVLKDRVESNHFLGVKPSALRSFGLSFFTRPLTLFFILLTLLYNTSTFYQGEANMVGQVSSQAHEVLLDTGCTDSATGFLGWLSGRLPSKWTMSTANDGKSKASCRGTATIAGLPLKLVHVPDFKRTLISWSDLNDMGLTATMGGDKIDIFGRNGKLWTTVHKGKDRLWHFTEVEKEQAKA